MLFKCLVKKPINNPISLQQFHSRRNKILVLRRVGGLGDILMHRMMFFDIHKTMPEAEITFAIPKVYSRIAENHPYIHKVAVSANIDKDQYGIVYDTTMRCAATESGEAPFCVKHRSDIWASVLSVTLTEHNMYLNPDTSLSADFKSRIPHPCVLFNPCSSASPQKNLTDNQISEVVSGLKKKGFSVIGLHTDNQPIMTKLGVQQIITKDLNAWLAAIEAVDYVITVDTAVFHAAGGLNKPMVGIFTYTDGKTYGKYFKKLTLAHKHRDEGWDCGPCYNYEICPKKKENGTLACIYTLTSEEILRKFDELNQGRFSSFSLSLTNNT